MPGLENGVKKDGLSISDQGYKQQNYCPTQGKWRFPGTPFAFCDVFQGARFGESPQ